MRVLIAGDYCPRNRVVDYFENNRIDTVLGLIRPLITQVDYSIVNLESPVLPTNEKPIVKRGPSISCTKKGVEALKWAGFNCVTLANNHFLDYGHAGVKETLRSLDELQVDHVGGGLNSIDAGKILYKEIKGKVLAVINCCEHEFSIATNTTSGCNSLNPIKQYYDIKEARKKADYVLIIIHGGHELYQIPSLRMIETYRFFIDSGADAVINHHQHCFSGYEVYKGKPIFYGLGNFCFDEPKLNDKKWNEGFMVELSLDITGVSFKIHPYIQCGETPAINPIDPKTFNNKIEELNTIIADPVKHEQLLSDYYNSTCAQYCNVFEPIRNRFYLKAKDLKLLPSFIGKKRILAAYNYVLCESHRDRLAFWLEKSVKELK